MAVGMAMALRINRSSGRVYCLIGDGECNEGSIWESALLGAHHGLSNLCCIVDFNHSTDRALGLGDLTEKFAAFGWESRAVDGHDHVALFDALNILSAQRPTAVIATTLKGKGCAEMEGNPAWHHRFPTPDELDGLLRALA
jgi:transketolase